MAGYERELAKILGRIDELRRQQLLTEDGRKELQQLQQKEQTLLDLIKNLQEEKILLLRSSGESLPWV